jgi:hypothetical protein
MSYVEALVAIRRSSSDGYVGIASKATFPNESLKRAWDMTFDATTAEDALAGHEVIAGLLTAEVERMRVRAWPPATKLSVLHCLRQQQVECANNVLRLREVIRRNEQVTLPF